MGVKEGLRGWVSVDGGVSGACVRVSLSLFFFSLLFIFFLKASCLVESIIVCGKKTSESLLEYLKPREGADLKVWFFRNGRWLAESVRSDWAPMPNEMNWE